MPELGAMSAKAIKRARFDQALDGRFGDDLVIDALAKIEDVLERAGFASGYNVLGSAAAQALDGNQTEANLIALHGEIGFIGVDVRRPHRKAKFLGVLEMLDHDVALVAVFDFAGQKGGHELGRVIRFEVSRL